MYFRHPEMLPFGSPRPEEDYNPLRDTMVQLVRCPSGAEYLRALESLGNFWTREIFTGDPSRSKLASRMWNECTHAPLAALRPYPTGRLRQERSGNWIPVLIDPLN